VLLIRVISRETGETFLLIVLFRRNRGKVTPCLHVYMSVMHQQINTVLPHKTLGIRNHET